MTVIDPCGWTAGRSTNRGIRGAQVFLGETLICNWIQRSAITSSVEYIANKTFTLVFLEPLQTLFK